MKITETDNFFEPVSQNKTADGLEFIDAVFLGKDSENNNNNQHEFHMLKNTTHKNKTISAKNTVEYVKVEYKENDIGDNFDISI
jgi:hypothetical protein